MRLKLLEELGYEISSPTTADQLFKAMTSAARRMGFDHFAVAYDQWIGCTPGPNLLIHNYPDRWARTYVSFDLSGRDPVRRACEQSFQGFVWRDIDRLIPLTRGDRRMFAVGQDNGIADGFTVPRHLPGQANAACTFAVGPGTRLPVDMLAIAEGVGAVALTTARRIAGVAVPKSKARSVLSDRQRDCALLSARGLTAGQIASELGIGKGTVIHHLRIARERYDVHCAEALLVCAIADGLFCLADVHRNVRGGYRAAA
ncbi:DNA-binding CsgD family transcriptional regulator [Hephaestia caeni]|jgi:DNA-binding CsgD family transcriptional regulator|uniref:DNA-binding CsgD family transcriptional regulator n=1 Tax=Hephaestia caeni TaxID=645617 RepID=A0A397PAY1_9SPHN|nr:LuxR family transcriptional regulator [Hephaestia caeni]RIA44307.1 DNA-binding CsgD family transcriptional regulator [Hephaestia caeni]